MILRPTSDEHNLNWGGTSTPLYAQVDDIFIAPDIPDTSDHIYFTDDSNNEIGFAYPNGQAATKITVWVYAELETLLQFRYSVDGGSTFSAWQQINSNAGPDWFNYEIIGSWTKAQIDQLVIRFKSLPT